MCGIAGYAGPAPLGENRIETTLRLMERRGPDRQAARRFADGDRHLCLLHGRLSIIDLEERADQPFRIGDKWLVFNGELYNYRELRRELEAEGYRFVTQSDTEVLLRVIDAWGWEALDRCEGMWAFALYDEADGSLSLCRDRFGEKPLHLYREPGGALYFGSEVKYLAALSDRRLAIDEDHLLRYLVNGYKSLHKVPHGFFRDVTEVPAASVLRIGRDGRETRWRYWMPDLDRPAAGMSFEQAVAGVRERLIRSVELRLRADVPLAFCMSGGVDSNALIAIAKRELGYDVHGFTIVNTDARYEEADLVQAAVDELGVRHTAIPLGAEDFLPRLRTLVRQHDAPVYTITYYVHWLLEKAVSEAGYRISISGTAADELFTGYFDHHLLYLYELRDDPDALDRATRNWLTHIRPVVRNPYLQNPRLFIENPRERGHIYLDAGELAACLTRPWAEPFMEWQYSHSLLRTRMLNELFHEATPVILHEDDLNAMYYSIENRSPFLDRELFEFSLSIPTRHLVRDGAAKAVLREAMRGIVPDPILDSRRKVGFNAPIEDLLDAANPAVRAELLRDSPIFDLVRRESIEALLDHRGLPNSRSKFLFSFINAKMFLEEFAA